MPQAELLIQLKLELRTKIKDDIKDRYGNQAKFAKHDSNKKDNEDDTIFTCHRGTVTKWLKGDPTGDDTFIGLLKKLYGPDVKWQDYGDPVEEVDKSRTPLYFKVPYHRNSFFTGRREILDSLEEQLQVGSIAAINQVQAISGLGGIGKTQVAVEYAYRAYHKHKDYQWVLWVSAGVNEDEPIDNDLILRTSFAALSKQLVLSQAQESDVDKLIIAVQHWLETHDKWLLVFDNADKPMMLKPFLPQNPKGRVLITSRAQVFDMVGVIEPIPVDTMTPGDSVDFLAKRVQQTLGILSESERVAANDLAQELGYFPLALEQAGAFIVRKSITVEVYLNDYRQRGLALLEEGSVQTGNYPRSVLTTWLISFEDVMRESPSSIDVLTTSAFLSPDSIPYSIIQADPFLIDTESEDISDENSADLVEVGTLLEPLKGYSLIAVDPCRDFYSVHRLVQAVVRDRLTEAETMMWLDRAVETVIYASPKKIHFENWPVFNRLLLHWLQIIEHAHVTSFQSEGLARIFNHAGAFLDTQGRYQEAQTLLKEALVMQQQVLDEDNLDVANTLYNLANTNQNLGYFDDVEQLYMKSLEIRKKLLNGFHTDITTIIHDLGSLYHDQEKLIKAESLFREALELTEQADEVDQYGISIVLSSLGNCLADQGRYDEAKDCLVKSLNIKRELFKNEHPTISNGLHNLAAIYSDLEQYDEAESHYLQGLELRKKILDTDEHPTIALVICTIGNFYVKLERYDEAESLLEEAVDMGKRLLNDDNPLIPESLHSLGNLYYKQKQYRKSEPIYQECLACSKKAFGADHPFTKKVEDRLHALRSHNMDEDMTL
ncbi:MAG: tetratricopeptide repeat protein [Cyanobacteria bacterium P01_A01_bin.17]